MAIKVFEVNDMEWWAGDCTPEQLLAAYMEVTGCTHEDATGDEDTLPRELSEEEMLSAHMLNQNEDEQTLDPPKISFRDALDKMISEGKKFPCLFACTEF